MCITPECSENILGFILMQATRRDSPSNPRGKLAEAEFARRFMEEKKKRASSRSYSNLDANDKSPEQVLSYIPTDNCYSHNFVGAT